MHLYIHVPFCRQACYYCDFHFSTSLQGRTEMVDAICREIELRKTYLPDSSLDTVYFGGGTPSLLEEADFQHIFQTIHQHFRVHPEVEITLEANPDDLSREKLQLFHRMGINRLSIGIQSFHTPHLQHLHRIHSAEDARTCVRMAQQVGFENITIDLIYAIPSSETDPHAIWRKDLAEAMALQVPHISAYCLTIEPQTVFGKWLKNKRIAPIDDEFAAEQFQILRDTLREHGYEQYEISNFARPGRHSQHNSSYWLQHPYLGVGPSAHSYDGLRRRQYNRSNNPQYVAALQQGLIPAEIENLTEQDLVNEYVLTSLRTHWGTDVERIRQLSETGLSVIEAALSALQQNGWIRREGSMLFLTETGKLFADRVAEELFWVEA